MAGDQKRYTNFVEAAKNAHDFKRQVRVEVASRFVGN